MSKGDEGDPRVAGGRNGELGGKSSVIWEGEVTGEDAATLPSVAGETNARKDGLSSYTP
jgi:hypothetical protein